MQTHRNPKGFTLVELAVSMVVIGLLLGLGMTMIGPLTTGIKVRESKENLAGAVESVNSWASGNNRLPDTTSTPATNPNLLTNAVKTPVDAWGRDFIYIYDSSLTPASATKDTICGRRSTVITITDTNTGATISNVAYLLISKSDDANTDTKIGTTAVTAGPISAATTITADTVYDLIRWTTLDELRTKVGCQGAQLRIVNNELPYGNAESLYPTVGIALDGGATPGTFRWCIESAVASPLPSGLAFTTTAPALPVRVTPTNTCSSLAEASWGASATLTISGTPAAASQGSYSFTVYVRDNNDGTGSNDNIAQKTFVLTINPKL